MEHWHGIPDDNPTSCALTLLHDLKKAMRLNLSPAECHDAGSILRSENGQNQIQKHP